MDSSNLSREEQLSHHDRVYGLQFYSQLQGESVVDKRGINISYEGLGEKNEDYHQRTITLEKNQKSVSRKDKTVTSTDLQYKIIGDSDGTKLQMKHAQGHMKRRKHISCDTSSCHKTSGRWA